MADWRIGALLREPLGVREAGEHVLVARQRPEAEALVPVDRRLVAATPVEQVRILLKLPGPGGRGGPPAGARLRGARGDGRGAPPRPLRAPLSRSPSAWAGRSLATHDDPTHWLVIISRAAGSSWRAASVSSAEHESRCDCT